LDGGTFDSHIKHYCATTTDFFHVLALISATCSDEIGAPVRRFLAARTVVP
jgi:ubiquinone biosynthesis protein Coq4